MLCWVVSGRSYLRLGIAKVLDKSNRVVQEKADTQVVSRRSSLHATQAGRIRRNAGVYGPEQARGEIDALSTKTDVYALGAMLYEILSGRPPYKADTLEELLHKVQTGDDALFHRLSNGSIPDHLPEKRRLAHSRPPIPEELIDACKEAMSRLQTDRYASAEEFSDVLQAWLEGSKKREKPSI